MLILIVMHSSCFLCFWILLDSRFFIIERRRTIYLLNNARDKAHILLGLRIAINNIDEVIRIIRGASDPANAKEQLIHKNWDVSNIVDFIKKIDDKAVIDLDGKCYLTEIQAKAILEMRLQRLTSMEKNRLENDIASLHKEITEYIEILGSRERLLSILKNELIR